MNSMKTPNNIVESKEILQIINYEFYVRQAVRCQLPIK